MFAFDWIKERLLRAKIRRMMRDVRPADWRALEPDEESLIGGHMDIIEGALRDYLKGYSFDERILYWGVRGLPKGYFRLERETGESIIIHIENGVCHVVSST